MTISFIYMQYDMASKNFQCLRTEIYLIWGRAAVRFYVITSFFNTVFNLFLDAL